MTAVSASDAASSESLAARFAPKSWFSKRFSEISWKGLRWVAQPSATSTVRDALDLVSSKRPIAVLVDEAHVLSPDVGRDLLNSVQALRSDGRPILLALAGTPDLPRTLRGMQSTFWERSVIMPLMRLDLKASADAIRIPLSEEGRLIESDALEQVAMESQGYPYFIQLWGEQLWTQVEASAGPIGMDDVELARPRFEKARNLFYESRYQELVDGDLVDAAAALSRAFRNVEALAEREVTTALRHHLVQAGQSEDHRQALRLRERLQELGYVWAPGGTVEDLYWQGIPSLMSFVAERARRSANPSRPSD